MARHKAIDGLRRESDRDARQAAAQEVLVARGETPWEPTGSVPDDRLRLVFTCCHPVLAPETRVALTLRLVAGLSTAEVARAFWVPEATMAQRLVRAKRKIADENVPYRVPEDHELPDRLAGVLRVVYLVFREGYAPSAGDELVRVELCEEAIRLARLVVELLPDEGEAQALLALLLIQHSRRAARTNDEGDLVLIAEQDRTRWDQDAIEEGLALTAAALRRGRGQYAIQAAIAACHTAEPVDWSVAADLYGELQLLDPSPAVVLNRAVAIAEVDGPGAALATVEELLATPGGEALARSSHQPHVARADFLRRLGRDAEAAESYERAAAMAPTEPERRFLDAMLARCRSAR